MHANSKVKIKFDKNKLKRLDLKAVEALEKTGEAIHTDLVQSQTMPFRTGNLQNTQTFVDYSKASKGKVSIISNTPYARRLYYHPEYNFSTLENPSAGGKWLEPYMEKGAKKDFAIKMFKKFYGGNI